MAQMNIDDFKSKLGAGGARPNQFEVVLTWPLSMTGSTELKDQLLVTAAALPASNVNPTIIQYRGREVKLAGERTFDPWTITVVNDTTMKLRKLFEKWSDLMNNRENNGAATVPADYMATLGVQQLDRNNKYIRGYIINNAFPITVSEVGLSYGSNDVISEFTVTFQYSDFEVTPTGGSNPVS